MSDVCHEHDKMIDTVVSIKLDLVETKSMVKNLDSTVIRSITDIEKHIEHGHAWRMAIVGLAATGLISLALQIGGFVYLWGQLTKVVEVNSGRICLLEELHPRVNNVRIEK
jgi:hypothetical protein